MKKPKQPSLPVPTLNPRRIRTVVGIVLAVVGIAIAVLISDRTQEATKPAVQTASIATSVKEVSPPLPAFEQLADPSRKIPERPWAGEEEMKQSFAAALKLIQDLRGSPELATNEDVAIYTLLRHYTANPNTLHVSPILAGPLVRSVSFGFNCQLDNYVMSGVYKPVAVLAAGVYHEFQHAAVCNGLITKYGTMPPEQTPAITCRLEPPGYAAEVRFSLALYRKGLWPTELGTKEGEMSDFERFMFVWERLSRGEMCAWLTSLYARRPELNSQPW